MKEENPKEFLDRIRTQTSYKFFRGVLPLFYVACMLHLVYISISLYVIDSEKWESDILWVALSFIIFLWLTIQLALKLDAADILIEQNRNKEEDEELDWFETEDS